MKFNLLENFYENFYENFLNHYFYKRYLCKYNILILDLDRYHVLLLLRIMFHMIVQEMFHSKAVVGEISCPIPSELSQVGRFQAGR